jgi:hypothetical protein
MLGLTHKMIIIFIFLLLVTGCVNNDEKEEIKTSDINTNTNRSSITIPSCH